MTTPRPGDRVVTPDGHEGVVRSVYTADRVVIDCDDGDVIDYPALDVVAAT